MAMSDWLDKYPRVKALLQRSDETLEYAPEVDTPVVMDVYVLEESPWSHMSPSFGEELQVLRDGLHEARGGTSLTWSQAWLEARGVSRPTEARHEAEAEWQRLCRHYGCLEMS